MNKMFAAITDPLYVKREFIPPNTKKGDNLPSPIDIQAPKSFQL